VEHYGDDNYCDRLPLESFAPERILNAVAEKLFPNGGVHFGRVTALMVFCGNLATKYDAMARQPDVERVSKWLEERIEFGTIANWLQHSGGLEVMATIADEQEQNAATS
jgi:hypothetical protein